MRTRRHNGFSAIFKVHSPRKGILRCAILSRCLIIALSAVFNYIIPDHEATDVFIRPEDGVEPPGGFSAADTFLKMLLGGLARWDAQHFLHIVEHGYIFENSLAFLPLFPGSVGILNTALEFFLASSLTKGTILLLSATIINLVAFLVTADVFYSLSLRVLGEPKLAYISAMLFCFNPASIFFSAPYSEAMYAMLSFSGIHLMFQGKWDVYSSIMFGLSACTRSNGLLNSGFLLYKKTKYFLTILWPGVIKHKLLSNTSTSLKTILKWLLSVIIPTIAVFVPFFAFQTDAYYTYCTRQRVNVSHALMNYAVAHNLVLPSLGGKASRPAGHWCHKGVPISYSYVQNHYWNVGFLKYFQIAQIPNFLLALPVVVLIFGQGYIFFRQHKAMCLRLGFVGKQSKRKNETFLMSREMFVFVVHAVFLTMFSFLFIHVQVMTRILFSASPVPYWFAAYIFHEGFSQKRSAVKLKSKMDSKATEDRPPYSWRYVNSLDDFRCYTAVLKALLTFKAKVLVLYFLSYFTLGAVLFSNFLPWT